MRIVQQAARGLPGYGRRGEPVVGPWKGADGPPWRAKLSCAPMPLEGDRETLPALGLQLAREALEPFCREALGVAAEQVGQSCAAMGA